VGKEQAGLVPIARKKKKNRASFRCILKGQYGENANSMVMSGKLTHLPMKFDHALSMD